MKAAVIGGGFAGLAAALTLQQRGHEVVVLERRGVLGGRATSFTDATSGDAVDSGTHFLVEGCRETLALLTPAQADDVFVRGLDWPSADAHAAFELLLNEVPERVDAQLAARLRRDLLGSPEMARPVFLKRGLAELHLRLGERFTGAGGVIRKRALATGLLIEDGRAHGVSVTRRAETREEIQRGARDRQETLVADVVISAVPWHALRALLPERHAAPFAAAASLGSRACVSIEAWVVGAVLRPPLVRVRGSEIAWIVDKSRLHGREAGPWQLGFVVAPEHRDAHRTNAAWIAAAAQALASVAAHAEAASIERALVLREPHAFFATDPESNGRRLPAETPVRGLILAGDWTATGLPACIEGAVRSGIAAAQLADAG